MRLQRRHMSVFLLAAAVCFLISLLIVTGVVDSARYNAWLTGGLLALALGLLGPNA